MGAERTDHGGRSRPGLGPAAVVLGLTALLGLVALASRSGRGTGGGGGAREPSDRLLDYAVSTILVLMALAALFSVYVLATQRHLLREAGAGRQRSSLRSVIVFVATIGAIAIVLHALRGSGFDLRGGDDTPKPAARENEQRAQKDDAKADRPYEPEFAWLPVAAVLALAGAGTAALIVAGRRDRPRAREEQLADALAAAVDETLDDLRSHDDPRRAVIAAYARMERILAAGGLQRRPAEAPLEYLGRVLARLDVGHDAAARLTRLFEWAKFSQHEVPVGMKDEAIGALEALQAELRAEV